MRKAVPTSKLSKQIATDKLVDGRIYLNEHHKVISDVVVEVRYFGCFQIECEPITFNLSFPNHTEFAQVSAAVVPPKLRDGQMGQIVVPQLRVERR